MKNLFIFAVVGVGLWQVFKPKKETGKSLEGLGRVSWAKQMSGKQLVKLLKKEGWKHVRTKGSHYTMSKGICSVIIPVHGNKPLKIGTYKSIQKTVNKC